MRRYVLIDKSINANSFARILVVLIAVLATFAIGFKLLWYETHSETPEFVIWLTMLLFIILGVFMVPQWLLGILPSPANTTLLFSADQDSIEVRIKGLEPKIIGNKNLVLKQEHEHFLEIQTQDGQLMKIPKILAAGNVRTGLHFTEHKNLFDLIPRGNPYSPSLSIRTSFSDGRIRIFSQNDVTGKIESTSRYF
jgi:hypothetical protein